MSRASKKPEQAGERAIRSGVFFLPEKKSPYQRYYTRAGWDMAGLSELKAALLLKTRSSPKERLAEKSPSGRMTLSMGQVRSMKCAKTFWTQPFTVWIWS